MDPAIFFPIGKGKPASAAKAICARCPVIEACLNSAIDQRLHKGIFGGDVTAGAGDRAGETQQAP